MSFTAEEKRMEAERELQMRVRLYPHWIEVNRISAEDAKHRIDIMREIRDEYATLAQREKLL